MAGMITGIASRLILSCVNLFSGAEHALEHLEAVAFQELLCPEARLVSGHEFTRAEQPSGCVQAYKRAFGLRPLLLYSPLECMATLEQFQSCCSHNRTCEPRKSASQRRCRAPSLRPSFFYLGYGSRG